MNILDMVESAWNFVNGYKTYIIAIVTIVWAISAYITGHMGAKEAVEVITAALATMSMRHALPPKNE